MIYKSNEQLLKEYKKLLIDNGLTQKSVADRLNLTRQAFSSYTGKKAFTFDDLRRLLDAVGYDLEYNFVPRPGDQEVK